MPIFKYNATDVNGKKKRGREEAPDVEQLSARLRAQGLSLLDYQEVEDPTKQVKLKLPEVAAFSRQLAALLSAGVPLIRAIIIMTQRDVTPKQKKVYDELLRLLQEGMSLSEAMTQQGRTFPDLMISMFRAAESSGTLDATCQRMAEHYEKEHRLNGKVKSASTYPIILICLVLGVVVILFTFVMPKFFTLFEGMELPWTTQLLMNLSDTLINQWHIILIVILSIVLVIDILMQQHKVRHAWDHFKLRVPKVGKLLKIIYTSRFARTLSSLYASGIPMIQALTIAKSTVGNVFIADQFDNAIHELATGKSLSQAISQIKGFDIKLTSTIVVGEESGKLEQMLISTSDSFDYEAGEATQRLVTMAEPLLIVLMALIVVFVLISVMMPMMNIYSSIG
ncbi:type II secretion system F family protein [Christensenellaceae bacterium OttesenSCG-928-L17]|nr:type II secretion system F family protein [Christensenellaceae bacterium OttesenSCG-928-L17]